MDLIDTNTATNARCIAREVRLLCPKFRNRISHKDDVWSNSCTNKLGIRVAITANKSPIAVLAPTNHLPIRHLSDGSHTGGI